MEIMDEKVVGWTEAKKILSKKAKERELGYEQKNALEHLSKFCKLNDKKNSDMVTELNKIDRLKDRQKFYITNILPSTDDELKAVFAHEIINLNEDEQKKIISVVKKFI